MNNNQILSASLLDILFDGRNKEYGAYELRAGYSQRVMKALSAAAILVIAVISFSAFNFKDDVPGPGKGDVAETIIPIIIPPDEVKPPEPLPARQVDPPKVKTIKYNSIDIVPDHLADGKVPDQNEFKNSRIDLSDSDGMDDTPLVLPAEGLGDTGGIIENRKKDDGEDAILGAVEIEASVQGGENVWRKYLERNLRANVPVDNSAPEGLYTVIVQFVVSRNGAISDVRALTSHGFGMEAEAVRVIKNGPKWNPAIQNGRHVNAYRRQPVTFKVEER